MLPFRDRLDAPELTGRLEEASDHLGLTLGMVCPSGPSCSKGG